MMTATGDQGAKGRKDGQKQEAAIKLETIQNRIDELIMLHNKSVEDAEAFSEAVKRAAEDSGLLASVIRRFVTARAGERFVEKRRESAQLELLFDEVGE